ncbi:MAG TPA: hypothetical protein VF696_02025 [Candidatus Paceibacterota bacterium]|jgi:hypothetical protein
MKKIFLIVAAIVALILVLTAFLAFRASRQVSEVPVNTNPFGGLVGSTTPSGTRPGSLSIPTQDGTVDVPDFTREGQPSWAGPDTGYQVAGSESDSYHILYYPEGHGFNITLLAEPLGETRRSAEAELRARLGLPDTSICKLAVTVNTVAFVSEIYAGRNLGLSFCTGSTKLP